LHKVRLTRHRSVNGRGTSVRIVLIWLGLLGSLASYSSMVSAEMPAALGDVEGRIVWVDFWASWCAPCRRSFPWMNAMHEKYRSRGLQIIGVNVDKDRESADEFLREMPARFSLRYDPAGELAEQFGVQAMPSSFLLDTSGKVIAKHYGFKLADSDQYEETINSALRALAGSHEVEDSEQ
jgi:cytochrome c biogenesis protein CcmG/thiol:disulfide interchange protein DsbE